VKLRKKIEEGSEGHEVVATVTYLRHPKTNKVFTIADPKGKRNWFTMTLGISDENWNPVSDMKDAVHIGTGYSEKNNTLIGMNWMREFFTEHGRKPNIVDAGTNIGEMCVYFSEYAETIWAFEPIPSTHEITQMNLKNNNVNNVILYNYALGSEDAVLHMSFNENGNNDEAKIVKKPNKNSIEVNVRRLDDFDFGVDYLKIDVEGHELEMLKGSVETIKTYKPAIQIECWVRKGKDPVVQERLDNNRVAVYGFLKDLGYNPYGKPTRMSHDLVHLEKPMDYKLEDSWWFPERRDVSITDFL